MRTEYVETQCKSALNRVRGMPFAWSLNPYRGCHHGCVYCYARVTHAFLNLDVGKDFDDVIFAKMNIATVLRAELHRPTWRREPVAIGTATDPYQPAEGRYRLTRACLEALASGSTPANVTTKGTLVVRDVDVLQALAKQAGCGVTISLITLDTHVWRTIEPGTPPPRQRLAALERLATAGIPCGLALAPILPGLTDSPATLEAVVRAAAEHGASWLWSGTLHLEPAVRDWYFGALERHFPHVVPTLTGVYGAAGEHGGSRYTPRAQSDVLSKRVQEYRARYSLADRHLPAAPHEAAAEGPRQVSMGL